MLLNENQAYPIHSKLAEQFHRIKQRFPFLYSVFYGGKQRKYKFRTIIKINLPVLFTYEYIPLNIG